MVRIIAGRKELAPGIKQSVLLMLMLCIGFGLAVTLNQLQFLASKPKTTSEVPGTKLDVDRVVALGRLQPKGKIIRLASPSSNQTLVKLLVTEGDEVKANQVIAITGDFDRYQAMVETARAKVNVSQKRLAQLQAGEKLSTIESQRHKIAETEAQLSGQINTQQAVIAQQEIELQKAELTYQRYATLSQQGAVSQADAENKRLQVAIERKKLQQHKASLAEQINTGRQQVRQSQATLEGLANIRTTDTAVAIAELEEALSQLHQAEVDLEFAYVRSPITGQVLSINTQVGEVIGSDGIVELGQTQQMVVAAEVYERNIQSIKVGQPVTVISEYGGFEGELQGIVSHIKSKIGKPEMINDDPSSKSDARVVRIEIQLNPKDSLRVKDLSNLQVRALINVH